MKETNSKQNKFKKNSTTRYIMITLQKNKEDLKSSLKENIVCLQKEDCE